MIGTQWLDQLSESQNVAYNLAQLIVDVIFSLIIQQKTLVKKVIVFYKPQLEKT